MQFRSNPQTYYRGTRVFLCLFDTSNAQSLSELEPYVAAIKTIDFVECLLLGNKNDLPTVYSAQQIAAFMKQHGIFTGYYETSSVTLQNIDTVRGIVESRVLAAYNRWKKKQEPKPVKQAPANSCTLM